MIPYLEVSPIPLGPVELQPFGLLIAVGILVGYVSLTRRVASTGQDPRPVPGFVFWMLALGLAGAVVLKLVYAPDFLHALVTDPRGLWRRAGGIASFGGLFAGLAGGLFYLWRAGLKPAAMAGYMDALAFVFPRAWFFGRMGCALTHDHPGARTQSWLGVRYPDGVRYDLGLLEVLFVLACLAAFQALDRRRRPRGFYLGLFLLVYGIFRMGLDLLHENPVRYLGLTVDQYMSAMAAVCGGVLLTAASRRKERSAP